MYMKVHVCSSFSVSVEYVSTEMGIRPVLLLGEGQCFQEVLELLGQSPRHCRGLMIYSTGISQGILGSYLSLSPHILTCSVAVGGGGGGESLTR